jgi:GT2 family glycosyltransferase/Flp pilus assembly protein TadD
MARRYLFGPVSAEFAAENLDRHRAAGWCRAFGPSGALDLVIGDTDSWESICACLPVEEQPEFLVLYLSSLSVPHQLWSAPVPIVGLIPEGPLRWHADRQRLPGCDLILTDPAIAAVLTRASLTQTRAVPFLENVRRSSAEPEHDSRFDDQWSAVVDTLIEAEWPRMVEHSRQRPRISAGTALRARTWEALCTTAPIDRTLATDLAEALAAEPRTAELHNALALVETIARQGEGPTTAPLAERAAGYFQRALSCDPTFLVAGLNLVEALAGIQQTAAAVDHARRTLDVLDRTEGLSAADREAGLFPPGHHPLRVAWDQAAWDNAGCPAAEDQAKRRLLRWRLHSLLAELTGELTHYYEAAVLRPDVPMTRAALGCALGRAGRSRHAIEHLRFAVTANPLDGEAARALYQAMAEAGDHVGQRRLARDRRQLAQFAPERVPSEAWFSEAPPVGDELASIMILCCNQMDYTRQCLQSVFRHTREPYELILVDNGSTDETPAYLEDIRNRPGPVRVRVLRNNCNRGYPGGCNQALAEAHGQYLVFLNNDTLVTAGWLDGLIGWLINHWPKAGMVGAVTNYSRPPQQIPVDYPDLVSGLASFAARRQRDFAGQALEVERLTGFCLLARRDVLQRVGGFDERYGLGFFDDDDLCVRVLAAGWQLLLALNVFVHHYGSRTFSALRIDCSKQLQENFTRFQEKWGPEHTAGYRLPPGQPSMAAPANPQAITSNPTAAELGMAAPSLVVAPVPRPPSRVSLCLIVKNEEANLPACLESVSGLVDEIVVVDTGSTDATKSVAARFAAKVADFPWVDSFAAARNESLRHATGDWIFWMDADDRLDSDNRDRFRTLLSEAPEEKVAYVMKCLCLPDPASGTATVVDHVRLFRRLPELRWKYRVHEQILPSLRRLGCTVRWSDVVIHHVGYQDPALRRRKLERDLRLLLLEDGEHPDDPFTLFNLGSIYQELGRSAEALPLFRRSLQRSEPSDSIVRKLYALIVQCQRQMGQTAEALATCKAGRQLYPEDVELLFQEGLVHRERGDLVRAEACLLQLLETKEAAHFASVDTGLRGYKAHHNLAVLYHEQGRLAEAEAQWRAAVAEKSSFVPAWLGLSEVQLTHRRWDELDAISAQIEKLPQGEVEAVIVRARGLLARREFGDARNLLQALAAQHPQSLRPRVILSHVLLQEGRDWAAAERALRDVLALDPTHEEACRNLTALQRQQGRVS